MIPPIMVYTWTFTAATPTFRCQATVEEASSIELSDTVLNRYLPTAAQCREYKSKISVSECQRCYQISNRTIESNGNNELLKPCTSFSYDRTYYQSTLVEEVSYKK